VSDQVIFSFTALTAFSLSATTYTQEHIIGSDDPLVSRSVPSFQFDMRLHGITLLCTAIFSLLLFVKVEPQTVYAISGGLLLFVFGVFDNLLGLFSLLKQDRSETICCLISMLLCSLFIAHLGNLLGTAAFGMPLWIALPLSLFSVLSVHNAIRLLDRMARVI